MKTLAVCLLMGLLGAVFAMDRVAAQTAPATGTQLITLGTAGGPLPRADRAQSSNLLVVNGALYLIDAGGSVTSRVVQSGHDFRKIGKIFITHPHSDHTAGLATLMVSQWEYQRAEPTDRTGGAHDRHHRTAGVAGRIRRRGGRVAAPRPRAADGDASDRVPLFSIP